MLEKLYPFRWQLLLLLLGAIFVIAGILIEKGDILQQPQVEIIEVDGMKGSGTIVVEVSGSVNNPGVYHLENGARIIDALSEAGDLTGDADSDWVDKYLNKAAPAIDGQKIYIPSQSETESDSNTGGGGTGDMLGATSNEGLVNINTATQSELESLWGIGPVTAQSIIEQRNYSSVEELLSKNILKQNVYDRNKDLLTIY